MPIQYSPFPEFQAPNINFLGALAQGQASRLQELQAQKLAQQTAATVTKEEREADKFRAEQEKLNYELASKKYDSLIDMAPRLNDKNYDAWYKQVTETFPLAAATLKPTYDPQTVAMLGLKGADLKPQVLAQHYGDITRFIRAGVTGSAEVIPGSEVAAPAKQKIVDLGDKGQFFQNETTGQLTPITQSMLQGQQLNMPAAKAAIANIESGGDYGALGPTTKSGDRAYGKYQVMGENISSWTKQALGKSLTPKEFLSSPEAQEKVFEDQFARNTAKYGSAQDAASVWFSGKPLAKAGQRADILGTTVPSYVNKFNAVYGRQAPVQNAMVAPVTGVAPQMPAGPVAPPAGVIAPQTIAPQPALPSMQLPQYPVGSTEANNQKFGLDTLKSAGFNPATGKDELSALISESTSGRLQKNVGRIAGDIFGEAPKGAEKIAQIKTIVNDAILKKLNGKLGAGISNPDREFIEASLGDLGNPDIPSNVRLAAWNQVKQVLAKYAGFEQPAAPTAPTAAQGGVIDFSQLPKRR
jgi:hypothetical protein